MTYYNYKKHSLKNIHHRIKLELIELKYLLVEYGYDRKFIPLIGLRIAQLNNCDYWENKYKIESKYYKTNKRKLEELKIWKDSNFFNEKEKIVLKWTENVIRCDNQLFDDNYRKHTLKYMSADELSTLTWFVSLTNTFNKITICLGAHKRPKKINYMESYTHAV